ncbi:MAG: DUF6273 domain-containing protein [Treponemataceae bacterium]|nr:DUF6273 domain-containing protein [Treponemataceae bacterium]
MKKKNFTILFALSCILMAFIVFGCNPEVAQRTLTSISVSGSPEFSVENVFFAGKTASTYGLTVTATYSDSSTANVSTSATITSTVSNTAGNVTVTYTEGGVTKTAEVTGSYYVAASDALTQTVIANGTTTITVTENDVEVEKTYDLVKFGDFPQTIAGSGITYSPSTVYNGWYIGSDGYFYERCVANPLTNNSSSTYTCSDGTLLASGTTYYFKVEPIEWRVLTNNYNSTGKKLLLAENILTANVPYYHFENENGDDLPDTESRSVGTDTTIRTSNYKYSQIRAYLNGLNYYNDSNTAVTTYNKNGFLQKAFTTSAQDLIETTEVDNSAASTNPDGNSTLWNSGTNNYACDNTSDKIFLLSEQEVTTSTYGFDEYNVYIGDSNGTTESSRVRQTTDYAKANFAYQSSTSGRGGYWWLRSPDYNRSYGARYVFDDGYADNNIIVYHSILGVCPALSISF